MGSALAWVIDVHGRKVLHLLLGDVEPDSVLDSGHGADRDGDLLTPPQMPLPEQHVGNPVGLRIDEQALHQADLTIEGMDVLTGTHLCFTRRDNLLDNEPGWPRHRGTARGLHAEDPNGSWSYHGYRRPRVVAFYALFVLSVVDLAELGQGATQPDSAGRGVD